MKLDFQNRTSRVETLPDGRYIVTDAIDVLEYVAKKKAKFEASVALPFGTEHEEYSGCRLIKQGMAEPSLKSSQDRILYVRVYETLSASGETMVGKPTKSILDDGRPAWTYTYRQFTTGTLTPGTVGTSTAPDNASLFLQKVEAPDDGAVRTITRTYVDDGLLDQQDTEKNDGKLLLRTLIYAKTEPSTPSGYVRWNQSTKSVNGFPVYTYSYARGNGEIDRDIDYSQSSDQGTTGVTKLTIIHLTASSVGTNPTTAGGYAKVGEKRSDEDGYRVWCVTYAKGNGLVIDEVSTRSMGALKIYHRVELGSAPSAPSPTISGTVNLFDSGSREDNGYVVYDYRWSEGKGQTGLKATGRSDGSRVYVVTELDATMMTPAYPGGSTSYLVDLDHDAAEGYYVNRATYIRPPETVVRKKSHQWRRPGLARFTGNQLELLPPMTRSLWADEETTYDVAQLDEAAWAVEFYASFRDSGVRSGDGASFSRQHGLGEYLADPGLLSGADEVYNGVLCDAFEAVLLSSEPTARPTGLTTIYVDNEEYLTALDGTVLYRRVKVTFTF